MNFLHKNELVEPLKEVYKKNVPILGICLGMQLMANYGMEFGKNEGLALINGEVISLPFDTLEMLYIGIFYNFIFKINFPSFICFLKL